MSVSLTIGRDTDRPIAAEAYDATISEKSGPCAPAADRDLPPTEVYLAATGASAALEPPQVSGPAEAGVCPRLNRSQTLDQRKLEFSGF